MYDYIYIYIYILAWTCAYPCTAIRAPASPTGFQARQWFAEGRQNKDEATRLVKTTAKTKDGSKTRDSRQTPKKHKCKNEDSKQR